MPSATDRATPMNMGTQCKNIDVENQNIVTLGGHTSDPLQNVLDWLDLPIVICVVLLVITILYLLLILPWLSVVLQ